MRNKVSTITLAAINSRAQDLTTSSKPNGLWYQFGTSWEDWTSGEMPSWYSSYRKKVHFKVDLPRVLVINTNEELLAFTEEFGSNGGDSIDWRAVARKWAGIEIPTYLYELRLDNRTGWYYTWDVASGCIWNADAIKITHIEDFVPDEVDMYEDEW